MRTHGTLAKWNDARGFGFVTLPGDGSELFVHVSAFPRDGVRPTVGELIAFEIETAPDGKRRAVKVVRAAASRARSQAPEPSPGKASRSPGGRLVRTVSVLVISGGLCAYAYGVFAPRFDAHVGSPLANPSAAVTRAAPDFACDGRTQCAQMTSCPEARYFLSHCPNTRMDGDGDGDPCEQQWCY